MQCIDILTVATGLQATQTSFLTTHKGYEMWMYLKFGNFKPPSNDWFPEKKYEKQPNDTNFSDLI